MSTYTQTKSLKQFWRDATMLRLTAYLFAVIFLAQAVWIYPAYRKFEEIQLKNLHYTGIAIMEAIHTLIASDMPKEEIAALAENLHRATPLKGVRVYDYSGNLVMASGEAPVHEPQQLHQEWQNWTTPRVLGGTRVEMTWLPREDFSQSLVVARMDSSAVTAALARFLNNLLNMVFGVAFASTLALLLILRNPTLRHWWDNLDLPSRSPLYKKI